MSTTVEVFVDYVCPFCFLVEDDVAELQRRRDVEVQIRPFELRPEPVPTLRPEDAYLPRIWASSVYPMARRKGVEISLPTISPQPRSASAFVGLQVAHAHGLARRYSDAMFRAFFQQDLDIGKHEVILDVADSVGLPRAEVTAALTSQERREQQRADHAWAAHTLGVTAVPSFRVHDTLVPGVLDADQLTRLVDTVTAGASS